VATTTKATADAADPAPACGNHSRSKSVWYRFTAARTGTVSANTFGSSYDTLLSVFSGTCGAFTPVSCNDNALFFTAQSRVTFTATAGTTYYFMITAPLGNGGSLRFQVTF
jgi:hypothetical protein